MRRIGVIGAGLAGLACARELQRRGREVVVFEKSRSLGGRCASREWNGCVLDHGAQFFTARSENFRAFLESEGSQIRAIDAPVVDAAGDELTTDSARLYHAGGNNRLGRALAEGLDVRREHPVDRAEPIADDRWRVLGEEFDVIISSAPWPQSAAIFGLECGPSPYERNLTVVLRYKMPFVGRARTIYAVSDRSGGPLAWSACENHKVGRVPEGDGIFLVQASPEFSDHHWDAPREVWSAALRAALEDRWGLVGGDFRDVFCHRWGFARRISAVDLPNLPPNAHLCGDSLAPSRVEDAWTSGHTLAEVLCGETD